jgi:hypothetical protein
MNLAARVLIAATALLMSAAASAAYVAATSPPLTIHSIYQNEAGDTFVKFTTAVSANYCADLGTSMYLYNREISPVDDAVKERRKIKFAIALSAKLAGNRVVVEYYYDPAKSQISWDACYVHGIRIVE